MLFQVLLHKHLELFMNHGQLEAKTMCAIFQVSLRKEF